MKNRLYFILFFLVFPVMIYCQIERKVSDFTKVTAFDQITVFLIPSNENKVEISGFNADKVELIVENGELKIKFPMVDSTVGNDILAKVFYVNLLAVEANDGCNIGASSVINTTNFQIIGKQNSKIKLNFKADKINARLSQGSKLDLLGTIDNLDVIASNSSKVFAKDCIVKQANVNVNAGGEIYVNASQVVDAKVRAGGSIFIHGNPKKVNKELILGGDIIMK